MSLRVMYGGTDVAGAAGVRLDDGAEQVDDQRTIIDFGQSGGRRASLFVRGVEPGDERPADAQVKQLDAGDVRALVGGMVRWLASLDGAPPVDRAMLAVFKELG